MSRVTVVIPAWNAEDFIQETVGSVVSQTIEVDVIVVDDGSSDATAARVREAFGERVQLVRQENQGVSAARNRGAELASGEYLCFLDADDWMAPTNLALKVQALDNRADAVAALSAVEVTDAELRPNGTVLRGADGNVGDALMRLIPPAVPCPSNVVMRRDVFRKVGGFDPELSTSADFDLWLRLSVEGPFVRLDEPLVRYRRHEGAMFANVDLQLHDMGRILRRYRGEPGPLGRLDWTGLARRFHLTVLKARVRRGEWGSVPAQVGRLLRSLVTAR